MQRNHASVTPPVPDKLSAEKMETQKQITVSTPNISLPGLSASLLFTLPGEIWNLLFVSFLKGTASFNLFRTYKFFSLFKKEISQLEDHPLRRLLSHGALGELEQAEAIWKKDLSLLTCYGTVYHPNRDYTVTPPVDIAQELSLGRYKYVERTYYQILMMNEEWEEAEEVEKSMTEEEKDKQFYEVFPNGEIKAIWDLEKALELLNDTFDAFIKDPVINMNGPKTDMSPLTQDRRNKLFDYIKPAPGGHRTGLVSDARLYSAALDLYETKRGQFQNEHQREAWNRLVEEPLASLLPTVFLRPHSQGIFKDKVKRTGCTLADGSSYFPFRRSSKSLPGSHFWVYGNGEASDGRSFRHAREFAREHFLFKNYVEQKREQKETLCRKRRAQKHRV